MVCELIPLFVMSACASRIADKNGFKTKYATAKTKIEEKGIFYSVSDGVKIKKL